MIHQLHPLKNNRIFHFLRIQYGYFLNDALGMLADDFYSIEYRHEYLTYKYSGFYTAYRTPPFGCRDSFRWGAVQPLNIVHAIAYRELVSLRVGAWWITRVLRNYR